MITIALNGAKVPCDLECRDALGRTVFAKSLDAVNGTLDLTGLANGCYFLQAQSSQGSACKLIEVMH